VEVEWSADGLEIRDDGRGVPPAVLEGMGLRAIRYRAEQLGYQVELRNGSTGAVLEVGARIA
jgi:signal transduction histidine kinase